VGTGKNSCEEAAGNAVEIAAQSLEDLRMAEGIKRDMTIDKNKVTYFRARVNLFFKYHPGRIRFLLNRLT
jgi:flavin-binding protein dodecin